MRWSKLTKIACVGKSVASVDTSDYEKNHPPLTDEQAIKVETGSKTFVCFERHDIKVAEMALRVSAAYGVPYDIEWARDAQNVIYLLQARPITSFSAQCDGLWSLAGFDASSVLTLSMSAHA